MYRIEIEKLSSSCDIRRMMEEDIPLILALCQENTQFYEYCGHTASEEEIAADLRVTPPGIPYEKKYYIGFFQGEELIAVMDLIDGHPEETITFIGFFMMRKHMQGQGIGSGIIREALQYLKDLGFTACRLAIDKENPQSNHFWRKNGFSVIQEVKRESGTLLYAEKAL